MMTNIRLLLAAACIALLCACKNPVIYMQYEVILPEIPPHWQSVLGTPQWRVKWVDADGNWQNTEAQQTRIFSLEICTTQITPVIAYPYWPEKNIYPGTFYPAGAMFPLDAADNTINLDWRGGAESQLYLYLARFNNEENRRPEHFDWQRFRAFLRTENEDKKVKADPWHVDWEAVAKKIAASGFRSSYIALKDYSEISVTIPESALWISPSPFDEGKQWKAGETVVLQAAESVSRYVSAKGTMLFTHKTWDFFPQEH
ncbi:MAG: hypothetical protein LBV20_04920 [Treponema sp.]|nr:hypothetical protein [Treponema sp.]